MLARFFIVFLTVILTLPLLGNLSVKQFVHNTKQGFVFVFNRLCSISETAIYIYKYLLASVEAIKTVTGAYNKIFGIVYYADRPANHLVLTSLVFVSAQVDTCTCFPPVLKQIKS